MKNVQLINHLFNEVWTGAAPSMAPQGCPAGQKTLMLVIYLISHFAKREPIPNASILYKNAYYQIQKSRSGKPIHLLHYENQTIH